MGLISGVESDAIQGQKGDGLVVCLLCRFLTTMVFFIRFHAGKKGISS
jgi:hypothetical protein